MEKELKSCTGILLRADLTGHSHPSLFWQKWADWLNWPCPVRSALKRTPVQDFSSFPIMFYYIISTTYQKLETYFDLHISGLLHSVSSQEEASVILLPSLLAHGCKKTSDCGPNNRPELVFSDKKHGWFLVLPLLGLLPNFCEPLLSLMFLKHSSPHKISYLPSTVIFLIENLMVCYKTLHLCVYLLLTQLSKIHLGSLYTYLKLGEIIYEGVKPGIIEIQKG